MTRLALVAFVGAVACVASCAPASEGEGEGGEGEDEGGEGEGEIIEDSTEDLDFDTFPCDRLDAFPHALESTVRPIIVHHRRAAELPEAQQLIAFLEEGWQLEIDELGMRAPLLDAVGDGTFGCGTDERLDVFLWAGHEEAYVDVTVEQTETESEDYATMMVVDPYGSYGGEFLRATALHELHHMSQAALDWFDAAVVYEMSATFIEDVIAGSHDSWEYGLADMQSAPELPVDFDDGYETYFMYGQALYLLFLREGVFDGDASFVVDMWEGMPSPFGAEPDYQDALDALLAKRASAVAPTFLDSVPVYARWRFYTGARDDGAHFARAAFYPEVATVAGDVPSGEGLDVAIAPALLGSAYVELSGTGSATVDIVSDITAGVRFVIEAVPGEAADADPLALPAVVSLPRTIIVTPLPAGATDLESRSIAPLALTLRVTR